MSLALAASALLLGLAGGPHCAVMCGGLQAGVAHRPTPGATLRAMAALQIGRLIGYSVAGAVVAASVAALSTLGAASPVLKPVWTLAQVGALVFGLALIIDGKVPAWLSNLRWQHTHMQPQTATVRFIDRVPSGLKAAGAGACWAAIPCGLLQSALIVAALANTAAQGAGVMAAFAAGSAVSLLVASTAWTHLSASRGGWARATLSVRLAGALLSASAAFALFHGLGSALQQTLCL